jgi:cobalt/nickel transport system ATP-binding protein
MTAITALEQAVVRYPGRPDAALRAVDFAVRPGERVGLAGDNGSGKTTLLLALAGLRPLASGRLLHGGRQVVSREQLRRLRRDVGIVFQNADDQLFLPTVLEDVAFGPVNLGCGQEEARARAVETLGTLGAAGLAHAPTHTLSGGQKRIVALATVLAMRPRAVLLDEPTNDLDARGVARLEEILVTGGLALVLVSHDHAFLARVATRTVCLHDGAILAPG